MKLLFFIAFCIINILCSSQHVFQFEGNYQGENVYIQNPYSDSAGGFCTQYITVNSLIIKDSLNCSAYEIRLDTMNLNSGDPVVVTIYRNSDCMPKIISKIINPVPTFEIITIHIDSTGVLKWSTENENGKFTYLVEQYVWNKWIKAGEVNGLGGTGLNQYTFITMLHSGINKFRVKQTGPTGKSNFSRIVQIDTKRQALGLNSYKFGKSIEFGYKTRYELYDAYGKLQREGTGTNINTEDLKKGAYYLNYDNIQIQVYK